MTNNEIFQLFQPQIIKGHRNLYFLQRVEHKTEDGPTHETMQIEAINVTKLDNLTERYDLADSKGVEGYHIPYPRFNLKQQKESV